ncbi:MAG: DNA adenine methylase [Candidatus Gastranaerophilaceae bacterium]
MKYVESKSRVAKDISSIINNIIQEQQISTYIEPFVGGGNLIQHIVCDNKFGYDNNEYLIEFWKQIQNGWNPLNDIVMTKDFYTDVKKNPNLYPKHIVVLCGFCATYKGKWFGGYANISYTKTGKVRNYYNEAVRNVLKQKDYIKDVIFDCKSYEQIQTSNSLF